VGTDLILIDRIQLTAWLTGSFSLAPATRPRIRLRGWRRSAALPKEGDLGLGGVLND
jgi:hypothetical protein